MAVPSEEVAEVFATLGDLEREFAEVELDALRRKEFYLRPLYNKRKELLDKIPDFWPTVFGSGPEEIQQFFTPEDLALGASLKSFSVERYQIESADKGEPRSLRFTFEFAANDFIQDTKLVKEFEYRPRKDGPGSLISRPVPIKWKSKKKDLTHGILDAAVELYNAEEALQLKNGDKVVDIVDREALWQHEKLREKLSKLDEEEDYQPSFFNWFGFRGAVDTAVPETSTKTGVDNAAGGEEEDDDDNDDDDEVEEMLEVEIFPAGEEVAIALAEELWTNAMDYFMSAQDGDADGFDGLDAEDDDDDDDDDDAPELVNAQEEEAAPPRKKQRKG
ncbi:nucleosome assembly protein family [Cladophialophora carrionii]|uniref:Nucleosome assembly protein family n=1 Tax=Cladophialophora carrionii TaxID=86049 RepID=A0A1C1CBJ1_9EURO|nr:nucleosome assembly protein family [Cladophialophora carrionii]